MNRLLTDRQAMSTLVLWLATVAIWLIFSPGIFHLIDTIAEGMVR